MVGTTSYQAPGGILRLQPIAGPPLAALAIPPGKPVVIGRQAASADIVLGGDLSVSRNHAKILYRGGTWLICDIGSKHGTYLNGVRIPPHELAPIRDGDFIRLGPWTFHVGGPAPAGPRMLSTSDDIASSGNRVRRVADHEMSLKVRERLDLLIDAAGAIATAGTVGDLAKAALEALIGGTGFPRAAFIRRLHSGEFDARSQVEVVASRIASMPISTSGEFDSFSLTVLRAADDGKVVVMDSGQGAVPQGQSMIDLRIQQALCAPVVVDGVPAAYLYLDSRQHESRGQMVAAASQQQADAPAFCVAIARVCGLAMANLNRIALDRRRRELEDDLNAARAAQNMLMPPAQGRFGDYSYAVRSCPGRLVAGDLFHAFTLKDGRTAAMIGDVAGKGIGAGILMSGAQAHLSASLRHHGDPALAIQEVNEFVVAHAEPGRFVSLFVAILDPKAGEMTFVDAGHGYVVLRRAGEGAKQLNCGGGPPVGAQVDAPYTNEKIAFTPGDLLVAFSDGLVEQLGADGSRFGVSRVEGLCGEGDEPGKLVDSLMAELRKFAGGDALDDDVTIAAVRVGG
ncbi:MAG: SpoIIE family protein phosphatase [Phycisphaerales bacterium]|nr:SpoIIE family protein phosphatase [Phycisphaerales bacterium]